MARQPYPTSGPQCTSDIDVVRFDADYMCSACILTMLASPKTRDPNDTRSIVILRVYFVCGLGSARRGFRKNSCDRKMQLFALNLINMPPPLPRAVVVLECRFNQFSSRMQRSASPSLAPMYVSNAELPVFEVSASTFSSQPAMLKCSIQCRQRSVAAGQRGKIPGGSRRERGVYRRWRRRTTSRRTRGTPPARASSRSTKCR